VQFVLLGLMWGGSFMFDIVQEAGARTGSMITYLVPVLPCSPAS
jgi:hypothetical protein